jgi:hypothetical protein
MGEQVAASIDTDCDYLLIKWHLLVDCLTTSMIWIGLARLINRLFGW